MNQSIGIFDSGLGGLTVLKVLAEKFPKESFCYLGDIARLPYGNKSSDTIRRYGLQILKFLKDQNVKVDMSTWNRRHREYTLKVKTGSLLEIADVLRQLLLLKMTKKLSFGERKMLDQCKDLIVKEIALSTGSPEGTISEKIDSLYT